MIEIRFQSLIMLLISARAVGFINENPLPRKTSPSIPSSTKYWANAGDVSGDNDDDNENAGDDDLRRMLEASWSLSTMGPLPTSAESGAEAAVESLCSAMDRKDSSTFFVDVHLPQYDASLGSRFFDAVLLAEFCAEIAKRLNGKSIIVVKDKKRLDNINRVFNVRGQISPDTGDSKELTGVDSPKKISDSDRSITSSGGPKTIDVDSFREELISGWKDDEVVSPATQSKEQPPGNINHVQLSRQFRFASMFGEAEISRNSDMAMDVVKAVGDNAKPNQDEGNIIIVSAMSSEETIAIRAMINAYKESKNIILVNCKLDPMPLELVGVETVYSILPLVARHKESNSDMQESPKIAVLRRFPRDWELYVDVGKGFELAASVPVEKVKQKDGPSQKWIASLVKEHLESRI